MIDGIAAGNAFICAAPRMLALSVAGATINPMPWGTR